MRTIKLKYCSSGYRSCPFHNVPLTLLQIQRLLPTLPKQAQHLTIVNWHYNQPYGSINPQNRSIQFTILPCLIPRSQFASTTEDFSAIRLPTAIDVRFHQQSLNFTQNITLQRTIAPPPQPHATKSECPSTI